MKPAGREAVALLGSTGVLAGLTLGVGWAVPAALGLAVATWVGLRLLVPTSATTTVDPEVAPGVRRSLQLATVARLRAAETAVRQGGHLLPQPASSSAAEVVAILGDLAALVEGDARDTLAVSSALDTVVDRTVAIVAGHHRVVASARGRLQSSGADRLAGTLATVARGLSELHRRLLEDDLRELAVDQRVVEELLSLEIHDQFSQEVPR